MMNLKDYLSKKGKIPKEGAQDWLPFCTLQLTTGSLWAGDPHLANADDGHVTKVPPGRYVVEAVGLARGRERMVSRLRVRLQSAKNPTTGKALGDTGTDSAMIGVCDIKAFEKACGRDSGEEVQEAIEGQTDSGFGIISLKRFPGAVMPFVPTGSDGSGPVLALMSGRKRVGIELSFTGEDEKQEKGKPQVKPQLTPVSLLNNDRDHFITRLTADGKETSFWLGGELKADLKFSIWTNARSGPVEYQVRKIGGRTVKKWSPLKKRDRLFTGFEKLGPGTYEIDFRIGREKYSALKLALA
jgi:hypothetical protein